MMARTACLLALLIGWQAAFAAPPPLVDPFILGQIADDEPFPLPRNLAERERGLPLPQARGVEAPPAGLVYCPAEFDYNRGLLIRWGSFNAELTELTVGATTLDETAIVYVVVDSPAQQTSAAQALELAGADMSQVQFIEYTANSVWIRDYGPRFIFEDRSHSIIDHTYNRPRPLDNLFPAHLATLWSIPRYEIPLVHGGGNFHLFTDGDAFMSSLILAENPGLTAQDVSDYYRDYQNLNLTIYEGFPASFDSTRHIDMWMQPVDEKKIIVGEYSPLYADARRITEAAVADLTARGYTVYRTPGLRNNGTHYTYTNAVVLNDVVLMSRFGGTYQSRDQQALAVFQQAFPDKIVAQVNCANIITYAGAIHCIVMHVPMDVHEVGDMNCDGLVDNEDIDPFVLALTNRPAYRAAWPHCTIQNADITGDGLIDNEDIDPFVALLTEG